MTRYQIYFFSKLPFVMCRNLYKIFIKLKCALPNSESLIDELVLKRENYLSME